MHLFSNFSSLPQIRTRQALLLLDFQNDFVRPNGALHAPNTADFLYQLPQLAQAFRRVGDVVWVRSSFEEPRPLLDPDSGAECIVVDDNISRTQIEKDGNTATVATSTKPATIPIDKEAFLSSETSKCCLPKTTGIQFPAPLLAAIDTENDTVLEKSHYSAFRSDHLVFSFRQHFVTEVYLCGSLSNVSVYATALDVVRHGFSVTLIEDCLGFRSFPRHEGAMRRMADILGANGITVGELLEELDWQETDAIARVGGPVPVQSVIPVGIEGVMGSLDVRTSPNMHPVQDSRPDRSPGDSRHRRLDAALAAVDDSSDEEANPLASLEAKLTRRRHGTPSVEAHSGNTVTKKVRTRVRRAKRQDPKSESTSLAQRRSKRSAAEESLGPGDVIGEGDSRIIYEIDLPDSAFAKVREEVTWQKMYHLSGEVPRLVAVQGQSLQDGSIPIYRHPADELPPLLPFTPTVDQIRVEVEHILGHPLNHALIQLYRDGEDRISEHSDKTLDVVRGSFICNVSLGAQRVMVLRTKASGAQADDSETNRHTHRVPMPHESLFILGEKTNMKWLHGIRSDTRPKSTKSAEERAFGGERISLTFRHIGTFIDHAKDTIWGQGAVAKSQDRENPIVHSDQAETERLIRAFGQENHATEFDWDAVYGGGFDVVNFLTTSNARLIQSGDSIADLRVKLCLRESGLRYDISTSSKMETSIPSTSVLRPIYVDPDGTTVTGDVNILTHLANRRSERPGVDTLQGGDRLSEVEKCLTRWRSVAEPGRAASLDFLNKWEKSLDVANYIAGTTLGIDDCAFWPVLRDIVRRSGPLSSTKLPNLHRYYCRMEKRACVKAVLEEENCSPDKCHADGGI